MFRKILITVFTVLDKILSPVTFLTSIWFLSIRKIGIERMIFSRFIFSKIGIFPIPDQFYQPLINPKKHLIESLRKDRDLPGIKFNINTQLELISSFNFNEELESIPLEKTNSNEFYYHNSSFGSGDSEFLYNIIRSSKPKK